ncbi:MAG: Rod shape-determining protein MreD [Bacteroidota bacterium]
MNRNLILIPVSFIGYLLLQALVLQRVVLFDTAFCLAYTGFILFLPLEFSTLVMMIIGFAFGLSLDMFQNSQGLHASVCVMLGFIRNFWVNRLTPQGGYEASGSFTIGSLGFSWFLSYAAPLILLHHLVLFFTEAGGFGMFWLTLGKALASFLFTLVFLTAYRFTLARG